MRLNKGKIKVQKKTDYIGIKVTPLQKQLLEKKAAEKSLSLSAYITDKLFIEGDVRQSELQHTVIRLLSRIYHMDVALINDIDLVRQCNIKADAWLERNGLE